MTEQELQDLREQSEKGRKAKIAIEFLNDFLIQERATTINHLETGGFLNPQDLEPPVIYLRLLRKLEMTAQSFIDMGDIAEKELTENGI